MEKVRITFELSKEYVSSVMTIMNLPPKNPADRERLLGAMDAVTIDADADHFIGDDTEGFKLVLGLILIGKTGEQLGL